MKQRLHGPTRQVATRSFLARRRILLDGEIILNQRQHGQSPDLVDLTQLRCNPGLSFD